MPPDPPRSSSLRASLLPLRGNYISHSIQTKNLGIYVASILCVSLRTVERRLQEFGLSCREVYSTMSDEDLDAVINSILNDFPETGYKRMTGFLRARGIVLQQNRRALIFINYNFQLVLSHVPLGSMINRTEIGTASISVLLLQFLLRCICDVLNSVLHV